ncbi:SWIM zinc finger family protein [Bacillus sp. m3-13]|uniref:SWIM zinc finger family protein n=1 Tax=Bacillus sp. m3-13 TaxID=406124 RepID=UPI0001E88FAB|nr:SWIM zinc finger family protein [Bacillus sp. m3-13]
MNIHNFQNHINKKILQRGYDYFLDGYILETYLIEENKYVFQVDGTEIYEVKVLLNDNDDITHSECVCPFDYEAICKHQVAAYYKIVELKRNGEYPSDQNSQTNLHSVLNDLSKKELIKIIEELTEKDLAWRDTLLVRYATGDEKHDLERCRKLIASIVRKYTEKGFINFRRVSSFTRELEEVLQQIYRTKDILLALDLAFLLLREAMKAFQYADDSDGDIGNLVTETMEAIEDTILRESLTTEQRTKAFHKLIDLSESNIFEGWEDFQTDLLSIVSDLATTNELREKLTAYIYEIIETNEEDSYKKYYSERLLNILFSLIEEHGDESEVESFMQENLKYSSFREKLIEKHFENMEYEKIINLTLEAEAKDKTLAGLVIQWKKIRYEAYKNLSLKNEQLLLAKELLLHGEFEYYEELKGLNDSEHTSFYQDIKSELKEAQSWSAQGVFLKLIETENDNAEILEYVKRNPQRIENYTKRLVDEFPDEVNELYVQYILGQAKSSSNRKQYQQVCKVLRQYKKISGREKQESIIQDLQQLYSNRPAFMDELNKI